MTRFGRRSVGDSAATFLRAFSRSVRNAYIFLSGRTRVIVEIKAMIYYGDVAAIEEMVRAKPSMINYRNENGYTPLNLAALYGKAQIAAILLENCADVVTRDDNGRTPLHNAARFGEIETASVLIQEGAVLDAETEPGDGRTPLFEALMEDKIEMAKWLIRQGADVLRESNFGDALQAAVHCCDATLLKCLIEHGAPFRLPEYEWTRTTWWQCAMAEPSGAFVQMLIDAGASPNDKNLLNQETPLHQAKCQRPIEILVAYGADLEARNSIGRTPLHEAVADLRFEAVEVLLACGASPNVRDTEGRTADLAHVLEIAATLKRET